MLTVWKSGSPECNPHTCKQSCNGRSPRGIEEEKLFFCLRNAKDFKAIIFTTSDCAPSDSLLVIVGKHGRHIRCASVREFDLSCKSERHDSLWFQPRCRCVSQHGGWELCWLWQTLFSTSWGSLSHARWDSAGQRLCKLNYTNTTYGFGAGAFASQMPLQRACPALTN